MKKFTHFISLGYFCSVALELERMGLRSTSSPFDWCISEFKGVINAIDNHFEEYLAYEVLAQDKESHGRYKNEKYNVAFWHDFNKYVSLKEQISDVQKKYDRRIERFYENICEPTLFVRYISDELLTSEGKSEELEYIESNYIKILSLLKSYNSENEIIFIANKGVNSDLIKIYQVEKDENDVVARKPITKNDELFAFLNQFEYKEKESNLIRYKNKKRTSRICRKLESIIKSMLHEDYIHCKQY